MFSYSCLLSSSISCDVYWEAEYVRCYLSCQDIDFLRSFFFDEQWDTSKKLQLTDSILEWYKARDELFYLLRYCVDTAVESSVDKNTLFRIDSPTNAIMSRVFENEGRNFRAELLQPILRDYLSQVYLLVCLLVCWFVGLVCWFVS